MQRSLNALSAVSMQNCCVAEQFVLGACRCWDALSLHPDPTLPWRTLAPVFAYMNVLSAMCAFERLFAVLVQPGTRRLRFFDADASAIHADEARVLSALAALQEADARSAVRALRQSLRDAEVRSAVPALARIAAILDGKGHRLPRWESCAARAEDAASPWRPERHASHRSLSVGSFP